MQKPEPVHVGGKAGRIWVKESREEWQRQPPGAGVGGGGLSMETPFGSITGITHTGPCAHVRAPRAMCTRNTAHTPWSSSEAT